MRKGINLQQSQFRVFYPTVKIRGTSMRTDCVNRNTITRQNLIQLGARGRQEGHPLKVCPWSRFAEYLKKPLLRGLICTAKLSARHPVYTVAISIVIALFFAIVGLFTNFRIESDGMILWTPTGCTDSRRLGRFGRVWPPPVSSRPTGDRSRQRRQRSGIRGSQPHL